MILIGIVRNKIRSVNNKLYKKKLYHKVTFLDLVNRLSDRIIIVITTHNNNNMFRKSNRFMYLLNKLSHKELFIKMLTKLDRSWSNLHKVLSRIFRRFNKIQEFLIESLDIKTLARLVDNIMIILNMSTLLNQPKKTPLPKTNQSKVTILLK